VTGGVGARAPVFSPATLAGPAALAALAALRRSAATLAAAAPGSRGRLRWRELGNKLEAYEIFRHGEMQARSAGRALPLASLVELADEPVPYRRLWRLEGLAYGHAEERAAHAAHAANVAEPRDWLRAGAAGLPAASLIALHFGIGLSLARRLLAASARAPAAELRRGLAAYVAGCRELALPGHAAMLLEAVGFIACLRLARRAGEVASELARLDEEAHACFWHGLGRALYFQPRHAPPWPGTPRRLCAAVAREAPAGEGRENALAGLAWAVTLVNLRHPRVLEDLLASQPPWVAASPGFAHGVGAAVFVWHDCTPHDPYLAAWRRHRPEPAGGELARRWERQVSGPAEQALAAAAAIAAAVAGARGGGPDRSRRAVDLGELFRVRPGAAAAAAFATAAEPAAPAGDAEPAEPAGDAEPAKPAGDAEPATPALVAAAGRA
jgi:hypothetical protein